MLYFFIKRWTNINKEIVKFLCYFNRVSYGSSLPTYVLDDTCLGFGFMDDFGNLIPHLSHVLSIFVKFIFIVKTYICVCVSIYTFFSTPLLIIFTFLNSNKSDPSIPETQLFQNSTLKILGHYHVWGQRSRSYSGSDILLIRIPFVPCHMDHPFLRCKVISKFDLEKPRSGSYMVSKVNVIWWVQHSIDCH